MKGFYIQSKLCVSKYANEKLNILRFLICDKSENLYFQAQTFFVDLRELRKLTFSQVDWDFVGGRESENDPHIRPASLSG